MNFRNFGEAPPPAEGVGQGRPQGLTRQPSVYSLTFDEFQTTWGGGPGKDFGSMNMDELLKNIWSAEETQAMATSSVVHGQGNTISGGNNLQRQGSLTLPRTLSQKTVDEVWKNLVTKDTPGTGTSNGGSNFPQGQPTLGEITLEEFLVRAGVVREDPPQTVRPNNNDPFAQMSQTNATSGLDISFQHASSDNRVFPNQIAEYSNPAPKQQSLQQAPQQHPLFPKPANVAFATSLQFANNSQLGNPGGRVALGIGDPSSNNSLRGSPGITGLGTGAVTVATTLAANHASEVIAKSSVDTYSLSPVPYTITRGRKGNAALEKVIERRQRRMIKNRESAARSRARKQAYTLELEAEIAKLKERNKELELKQAEMMQMQNSQVIEKLSWHWGGKRQHLRRTLTGPW